ncbi:YggS family pyridoxal phosphate-dependent enzyme [Actinocorallia populi]|uniref:YggS family pyridoxal phosphate-dependent enzyme n=1 Tax=Actinocorallia populi TaxID=2079200 RepID=UPI000D093D37|nr:YggS family pyridoxal phosphate-dependent enzyme [Actinocorallia populi]
MTREEELAANLRDVRERVALACRQAGRDPGEVTLVAVTKTFPASDVRLLSGLGVTDVGENRDQEAAPKAAACGDLPLVWHFVGALQTNKVASVVRYAKFVHSVDRPRLVEAISREAVKQGREVTCLVQVSLDPPGSSGRSGVEPEDLLALADRITTAPGLRLGGIMAVAPLGADPAPAFERLAGYAEKVRTVHSDAGIISAGMSGDLKEAIACGATHVRIGTALLGGRRAIVG